MIHKKTKIFIPIRIRIKRNTITYKIIIDLFKTTPIFPNYHLENFVILFVQFSLFPELFGLLFLFFSPWKWLNSVDIRCIIVFNVHSQVHKHCLFKQSFYRMKCWNDSITDLKIIKEFDLQNVTTLYDKIK